MFAIKNLSGADLELIKAHLKERTLDRNDVLYESGFEGSSMYFVEMGSLKVVNRKSTDGLDEQVLGAIKPGGFCGEEVILNEGGIYNSTVVAFENSMVYELSQEALQKIMVASTVAGSKLILGISKSYREAISLSEKIGKMIAFVSPKDGSGKTTICMNLAESFARRKKKVLVVDCDFQLGNTHMHIGRPANPNLSRLIQMEERLTFDRIQKFMIQADGFQLLAAPELPQDAELITRSHMNQILLECAKNYDYIFLDVGSHIDDFSLMLWDIADMMILIGTPCLTDLTRFKRLMSAIKRLNYPLSKFVGLVNNYAPDERDYLDQFKEILAADWLTVGKDGVNVSKALFNGCSVISQATDSPVVMDFDKITEKILTGRIIDPKEKAGIFSWLKDFYAGK